MRLRFDIVLAMMRRSANDESRKSDSRWPRATLSALIVLDSTSSAAQELLLCGWRCLARAGGSHRALAGGRAVELSRAGEVPSRVRSSVSS